MPRKRNQIRPKIHTAAEQRKVDALCSTTYSDDDTSWKEYLSATTAEIRAGWDGVLAIQRPVASTPSMRKQHIHQILHQAELLLQHAVESADDDVEMPRSVAGELRIVLQVLRSTKEHIGD